MCFAGTFLLGFIGLFTTGNQWLVIWQLALALLPQPICENSRTSKLSQIKVSNQLFWLMLQKSIAVNDPEPHPNQEDKDKKTSKQWGPRRQPWPLAMEEEALAKRYCNHVTKGSSFAQLYFSGCKRIVGPTRPRGCGAGGLPNKS